jgi:RNA polymerase sigma factor (sigma-70 family)
MDFHVFHAALFKFKFFNVHKFHRISINTIEGPHASSAHQATSPCGEKTLTQEKVGVAMPKSVRVDHHSKISISAPVFERTSETPQKPRWDSTAIPITTPSADPPQLSEIRRYLTHREHGLRPNEELEAAWNSFYDFYSRKIRAFAFSCGAMDDDIPDCIQEVWRELLVRLPTFQLDSRRGKFDTWLYHIVQGKTADLRRSHRRRLFQGNAFTLQTVTDHHPSPGRALEEEEVVTLAWVELRKRVSQCNFQVLHLRLVEERPVAEVAEKLGLSHDQVWYRLHRTRRELEEIGSELDCGKRPLAARNVSSEKPK